ncbi:MAG: hypothetical protein ACI89J_004665 [Hyphomicrobiaceae bacterium]|jgi:hypothetical protein
MSDPMITTLARLLDASLAGWQLTGDVREANEGISLRCNGTDISIERAPRGMPFRWVLMIEGRKRTAASVGGVLRIVRQTLAPRYEPLSLRIAPAPIVPLPVQSQDAS